MEATEEEVDRKVLPELEETDYPDNAVRMLREAVQLFARKGYKGTSVREIVQAAQVTNPMLYYYFDDKQGLFEALMNFLFETVTRDVAESMKTASNLEEAVEGVLSGYFQACRRSPVAVKFVYTVLFGPTEGTPDYDVLAARRTMFEGVAAHFSETARIETDEEIPRDGFSAEFLTEQLFGLINNHLIRALTEAEQAEGFERELRSHLTEEAARDLRNFFFRGASYSPD